MLAVGKELVEWHGLLAAPISILAAHHSLRAVVSVVVRNCVRRDILPAHFTAHNSLGAALHLVFLNTISTINVPTPKATGNRLGESICGERSDG